MKRRLPITRKGEIMLAAISLPPLTADANRHSPAAAHPGRAAAAVNAPPTAATANPLASAAGAIACPPRSTARAANPVPITGARCRNRRTQPRAVVCGKPGDRAGSIRSDITGQRRQMFVAEANGQVVA